MQPGWASKYRQFLPNRPPQATPCGLPTVEKSASTTNGPEEFWVVLVRIGFHQLAVGQHQFHFHLGMGTRIAMVKSARHGSSDHCWKTWKNDGITSFFEILVGGIPTPLKNMSSSVGIIIPNIWKVIKFMFQTTNQNINQHVEKGRCSAPRLDLSNSFRSGRQVARLSMTRPNILS